MREIEEETVTGIAKEVKNFLQPICDGHLEIEKVTPESASIPAG